MFDPTNLQEIIKVGVAGFLGAMGGVARFFFDVDRGRRNFSCVGFMATTGVAFIAGCSVGELLPEDTSFYGITMVAGFYGDYVVAKIGKAISDRQA